MSAPNMNQIKPIAPKPNNNSTKSEAVSTTTSGRQTPACRRKQMAFQHPTFGYAIPAPLPAKVARRNARERNRVKQVNCGFEMLRTHIPSAAKQKKMSKVDTLRHAVDYIQKLRRVLREQHLEEEDDGDSATPTESPLPPTSSAKPKAKKGQGSSSLPPLMLPKPSSTSYSLPMTSSYNSAVSPAPSTTYSAPMTPRTPVTPTQSNMDFLANNPHLGHSFGQQQQQQHYMSANESGYESPSSASFYCQQQQVLPSPGSSSVRSSLEAAAMNNHMNYHQDMLYSPKAHQQQQQQMHYSQPHPILPHQQEYQYYESAAAGAGTNSEEDELLDVIAKWQDD